MKYKITWWWDGETFEQNVYTPTEVKKFLLQEYSNISDVRVFKMLKGCSKNVTKKFV